MPPYRRFLAALVPLLLVASPSRAADPIDGSASPPLPYAGDRRPIPDPTLLTTQQLQTAIAALREIILTRLEGMDKALVLLQSRADKVPSEVDIKTTAVRELLAERFRGIELQFDGIQLQFKERDTRVEQTARDSKTAVDAALQAAKEAVEKQNAASSQAALKSEIAFTKSIDQLAELFRTATKSLEDKIQTSNKVSDEKVAALDQRITRVESLTVGQRTAQNDSKDSTMLIFGGVGMLVGIIGIVLALATFTRRQVHS